MNDRKALLLAPMGSVHRRFNDVNIKALQHLGYRVHLAANFLPGEGTEQQNPEYVKECENRGIVIHSLPYQRHEIKHNIRLIKPTKELIEKESFDLIHAHTETGGLILRVLGNTKGRKIYSPHGMSFYKGSSLKTQLIYRPIEHWICAGMDCNIAINQEEYEVLKKWNENTARLVHGVGLDIERIHKKQKGRDEVRQELGIPKGAKVVLSIGELDDNKNHIIVVEAVKTIPQVYYVICGIGPNGEKLKNAGLGNRLILAGYRKDVPDIIGASDVFAFPSFHEGLPVSVMEAMAGGLPVACSDIRGNRDLIDNGKNGYTVKSNDKKVWAKVIKKLLKDGKSLSEYGKQVIKKYSCDNVYNELIEIYQG